MQGLLLKDWYMIKKYCRAYLLLTVIFTVVSFFGDDNLFLIFYPCLLCGVIPVNLIAYDENSRWTQYSEALPYTRAQIVSSKYLIGIFTQLAVMILTVIAQSVRMNMAGNFSLSELLMIALTMLSIAGLSSAICLPFIFKMGVEKGRTAYYVMVGIVCAGAVSASMLFGEQAEAQINLPIAIIAVISVAIYALSWYLSIQFYKKREL